jgi:hypothetical protein
MKTLIVPVNQQQPVDVISEFSPFCITILLLPQHNICGVQCPNHFFPALGKTLELIRQQAHEIERVALIGVFMEA